MNSNFHFGKSKVPKLAPKNLLTAFKISGELEVLL